MKKSIPMRAAGALFIGVMLTAGMVSGSFAKYVTQDSSYDAARVAQFGVVASLTGDLFGDSYKAADDNTVQAYSVNNPTVSANAKGTSVVAPGTRSTKGMTVSVTGTPEVSTQLTLDDCVDNSGNKVVNTDIVLNTGDYGVMVKYTGDVTADTVGHYFVYDAATKKYTPATAVTNDLYQLKDTAAVAEAYKPLQWKVGTTACADVAAVKAAIDFATKTAHPNQDLATVYGSKTITWEWPFETGTQDSDVTGLYANDAKDTILGDMIVGANDRYAVVVKNGNDYDAVQYASVHAAAGSANQVQVAYTGTAPALATDNSVCAVLTVTFGARLTVTQID